MSDANSVLNPPDLFKNQQSWAERNGFADWALALIWLVACVLVFQFIALIIAGVGYALVEYVVNYQALMDMSHRLQQGDTRVIFNHLNFVFIANSTWQVLFLGLSTYLFVRVCSGKNRRKKYLRIQTGYSLWQFVGIAVLLIVAAQPLLWFLGWLNSFVPVPETFENLQRSQMDLLGSFLKNNGRVWFALLNIALVPAFCEEILFRGFVFRSFEKKWGMLIGIILSGLLFGLYHIQLSNLLPLACIGMLLALLAWSTDSIFPSMAAHLINNAAAILVLIYYPNSTLAQNGGSTMPSLWLVILSGLATAYLIYLLLINHSKPQTISRGVSYDE